LLIGVPGRSNAFAISQRLGLNENVVKMAKERISAENSRFEDVVSSLEQNRVELEKERENLLILKQKAENALKKAEEKLEKVTKDKELEIEKARHQAKKTVDKIVLEAESIIEELDNLRKQKDNPDFSQIQIKARQEMRNKLKTIENKMDPVKKVKNDYTLPRALKIGDDVLICDINSKGVVLENADSSGAVLIQAGIMKLKVKLDNLKLIEDNSIKNQIKSYTKTTKVEKTQGSSSSEIKLIGMNVEEALLELDRFIDSSVLSHIMTIRIVHGKGAGILRKAVGTHLKKHKQIRDFRLGVFGEGEDGVTIANLK
ncbi:MAG: Smr/MutS family protein, partial [Oscillospiraceae bacterium]